VNATETTNERLEAGLRYIEQGLPVTYCDGKSPSPMGNQWHKRNVTPELLTAEFEKHPEFNIGLRLGPAGGLVDVEADNDAEERLYADLFDGVEPPITPTFKSRRGKHRLFRFDDRLEATGKAVVKYRGQLGIRIGCNGKGCHSLVPPSYADGAIREWLPGLSLGEVNPPPLPQQVVRRIVEAAGKASSNGKARGPQRPADDKIVERARKYLAAMPFAVSGEHGHDKTFAAACALILGFALSADQAYPLLAEFNERCEPPWSDKELWHKLREADNKPGERGYLRDTQRPAAQARATAAELAPLSNASVEFDEDGKPTVTPLPMADILANILAHTGGWPKQVGGSLFVHAGEKVNWLSDPAALFGWLQSQSGVVDWRKSIGCVTKGETFAELQRTAEEFKAIEYLPHVPEIPEHYYACPIPRPGTGDTLRRLLDRFQPATTVDRDLIQAAFMTALWGGDYGLRPAFVITADAGRGVGKTSLAEGIGRLFGGCISFSKEEETTKIKSRLLDPTSYSQRIALLDNVKTARFSWADLEALITCPVIGGWRLYCGNGTRPNTLTWLITLNGASLSSDMAQRSVIIKVDKPRRKRAWEEKTRRYIDQNRDALLADIVGALKAERHPLASYNRWAAWEGDVLERLPEPGEAQRVIAERQNVTDVEIEEADIIEDQFRDELERAAYETVFEAVFVPSKIARQWISEALGNSKFTTTSASRLLKQLIHEDKIRKIVIPQRKDLGRGFIWIDAADPDMKPATDLQKRLSERFTSGTSGT